MQVMDALSRAAFGARLFVVTQATAGAGAALAVNSAW